MYDGGIDIHGALSLSGEPLAPQISGLYGDKPSKEFSASEISANNIAKREYLKEYLDYWNSTQHLTETDRPVDAMIMPLAPFAAARPGTYKFYGYSSIINVLDYTSCTIPVTKADKSIDVVNKDFAPMSDMDRDVADSCK